MHLDQWIFKKEFDLRINLNSKCIKNCFQYYVLYKYYNSYDYYKTNEWIIKSQYPNKKFINSQKEIDNLDYYNTKGIPKIDSIIKYLMVSLTKNIIVPEIEKFICKLSNEKNNNEAIKLNILNLNENFLEIDVIL